jgi:hypothetical protein
MKDPESHPGELTARERLAVSRQLLLDNAREPLWAGLARWGMRQCAKKLEPKRQSNQAAGDRILS